MTATWAATHRVHMVLRDPQTGRCGHRTVRVQLSGCRAHTLAEWTRGLPATIIRDARGEWRCAGAVIEGWIDTV